MPKRRTQQRRRRTASQTIEDRIKDLNRSLVMKRRQLPDDFEINRFQKKMDTSSKLLKTNRPLYHQKVEKLERSLHQNSSQTKKLKSKSTFFNLKGLLFLFIIPIIIIIFFTLPIDFSLMELIIIDVLSMI